MSDSDLLETQLRYHAATSRAGRARSDELPDDLLREATQRLGILALVWAGLFVIGLRDERPGRAAASTWTCGT